MEGEYKINKLNSLLSRLINEKLKREEQLQSEVKEKKDLVKSLIKERKKLRYDLQTVMQDI